MTHDGGAAADAATLRQQFADFDRAVAARDLERILTLFAGDAVIFGGPHGPIAGSDAIRAWWNGILDQFDVDGVHEVDDVSTNGDMVVVLGNGRGSLTPRAGGDRVPIENWFLHVYRREPDGALRYWRGAFGPAATGSATIGSGKPGRDTAGAR